MLHDIKHSSRDKLTTIWNQHSWGNREGITEDVSNVHPFSQGHNLGMTVKIGNGQKPQPRGPFKHCQTDFTQILLAVS